jgi:hypothetical protein
VERAARGAWRTRLPQDHRADTSGIARLEKGSWLFPRLLDIAAAERRQDGSIHHLAERSGRMRALLL